MYSSAVSLTRYISVNRYFMFVIGNVFLSSILLISWRWLLSGKRGINVIVAPISGYPVKPLSGSRKFALNANRHIGISLENISERHYKDSAQTIWRREGELNPRPGAGPVPWFCRPPHCHSGISPLNGTGEESASQTFAPHLYCKIVFPLIPLWEIFVSAYLPFPLDPMDWVSHSDVPVES